MDKAKELIRLATEQFGKLTDADRRFFEVVANGETADYRAGNADIDESANAEKWGDERQLKANRIEWLCTNAKATKLVTHKGIDIEGVFIEGKIGLGFAKISFPLSLLRCNIKEGIDIQHAEMTFLNLGGTHTGPVTAYEATVRRGVYLRNGFEAEGEVRFLGAEIGGNLDCENGKFRNKDGKALSADGATVRGGVFLRNGFEAEGEVRFLGAEICGNLSCVDGKFRNKDKRAISADGVRVRGSVYLRDSFEAEGEVRFLGAEIGGNLECDNGKFKNEDGKALNADKVEVRGAVYLRNGFESEGEVNFIGAKIGSNLECDRGKFRNKGGYALSADGARVEGHVYFRGGFKVEGVVSFVAAEVRRYFIWREIVDTKDVELDLRSARIGTLWDDEDSWPERGRLFLHGLEYDRIDDNAPKDAKRRIDWLSRQVGDKYRPQPHNQLAKVLKKEGYEEAAKLVLIEREKLWVKHTAFFKEKPFYRNLVKFTFYKRLVTKSMYKIYGFLMGYGHRLGRAFLIGLVLVIIGHLLFGYGYTKGIIIPKKTLVYVYGDGHDKTSPRPMALAEYPEFSSFTYSLDIFIPIIELNQAKYWRVDSEKIIVEIEIKGYMFRIKGGWLRRYMLFEKAIGCLMMFFLMANKKLQGAELDIIRNLGW